MCPAGEDDAELSSVSSDLTIVVAGSNSSADNPYAPLAVDATQALSGSGLSITVQESEFFVVKENCPFQGQDFRLLSVTVSLKGANTILVLATGSLGMIRAQAMVSLAKSRVSCGTNETRLDVFAARHRHARTVDDCGAGEPGDGRSERSRLDRHLLHRKWRHHGARSAHHRLLLVCNHDSDDDRRQNVSSNVQHGKPRGWPDGLLSHGKTAQNLSYPPNITSFFLLSCMSNSDRGRQWWDGVRGCGCEGKHVECRGAGRRSCACSTGRLPTDGGARAGCLSGSVRGCHCDACHQQQRLHFGSFQTLCFICSFTLYMYMYNHAYLYNVHVID